MIFSQKELKLLKLLLNNSRATHKELSKLSQLTPETVSRKVTELKKKQVIKAFSTQIDLEKLGLQEYICFIKLHSTTQEHVKFLQNYLMESKYTSWIGKGLGSYDFKVSLFIKSFSNINDFQKELYKHFSDIIASIELNQVIVKKKNPLSIFFDTKHTHQVLPQTIIKKIVSPQIETNSKSLSLSSIEYEILSQLSDNSRISLVELSNTLHSSVENIHYHIKRLKQLQIIKKYSIVLNGIFFNTNWTILLLKTNPNASKRIIAFALQNRKTTSVIEVLGKHTIQITFTHKTLFDLHEYVNTLNEEFEKEIFSIEYFFTHNFYKYPKLPKIVLEL